MDGTNFITPTSLKPVTGRLGLADLKMAGTQNSLSETPAEQVEKAHAKALLQEIYLDHKKLTNLTKAQWDAFSAEDKGLLIKFAKDNEQKLPSFVNLDDDDDDQPQPANKKHWLLLAAEATGVSALAERAWNLFHPHRHRIRLLWKLIAGKKVVTYVQESDPLAKEKTRTANEAAEVNDAMRTEKEAAELTRVDQTGLDALKAERALNAGRDIEGAGKTLRTATEAVTELEDISKLTRITRVTRKGTVGGLLATFIVPLTAAAAWAKTSDKNLSNEQLVEGSVNVFKNIFYTFNKDWIEAFGKGDIKEGLDQFFGISDSIRLIKLAHDNPDQFKKEMREMVSDATKFGEWARNNPEKLNKLLQDPEKYMQDPQFARDIGTAIHEGLDGNRNVAGAKGLDALQRAQKISANGTYKQMGADISSAPQVALDPRRHVVDRNPENARPTDG